MLDAFWGGYMFHPAALDYSGDTCQNGCAYCFANINKKFRAGNLKGAINSMYKEKATTYLDLLLQAGYPICLSNRSDAFSKGNLRDTQALFTHLAGMKNGLFIQTKGSPHLEETLATLGGRRDVVIYITITAMKDELAKIVEPYAPLPSERLALAKRLHAAGYLVLIAINPCTESWMPQTDLELLAQELKAANINHICLEMLDLKQKRLEALGDNRKQRLGEALNTLGAANREYVRECTQYLIGQGFTVCKKGMPFRTEFFNDISARLGLTMPVLQDFVNHCIDTYGGSPAVISYAEFQSCLARSDIFRQRIPQNSMRGYLLRSGFDTWKTNPHIHSHEELLRIIWNDHRSQLSIRNHSLFGTIGADKKAELDADGNVRLFYDGTPHFNKKGEVMQL